MLGQCSHQFVWPRRATDGRYYQVCRICEAEYEYDWESMQRLPDGDRVSLGMASIDVEYQDREVETAPVPETVASGPTTQPPQSPPLRLLLEPEPAHRVFLGNLADLILFRSSPPIVTSSAPAPFWSDVFVHSRVPWWWFVESLLGHMIVVTAVLILFQKWPASGPIEQPSVFRRSSVSYYVSPKSFPALGSHASRAGAQPSKRQSNPVYRPTIRVAPERAQKKGQGEAQRQAAIQPPNLAPPGAARLRISAPNTPAPMMPLSATGRSHLTVPAGPTWVVAPPPDSRLATARRSGLPQASAVAPAPEVAGVSSGRAIARAASHTAVIAPPPSVSGSLRRVGEITIGESAVVKPAPQLPMGEQGAVSAMVKGMLGGVGSAVVPPPPSVQSSGSLSGGRSSLFPGTGLPVVAPAPALLGAGNLGGRGGANAFSPAGLQVVAPAPSLQGAGHAAGSEWASSLSTGLQAVPPAPSLQGPGGGVGGGRSNSMSAGLEAVPPVPSVQGEGGGPGGGQARSLSGAAPLTAMPPAASGQDAGQEAGDSAAGGHSDEMEKAQASASSATDDRHESATVEMPLRLIGPVLALPGSSYFSNYEVFIAERKLGKDQLQLIKLVYISLPYQRRLSEYGPNNWTVRKLRVTRDRTCDESLLQMTWPETDPRPDSQPSADSPALSSRDRNGTLPCYRTTADDYRLALSKSH